MQKPGGVSGFSKLSFVRQTRAEPLRADSSIDLAGDIYLDKEKMTAEQLAEKLSARHAENPDITVQFEVDEKVPYGKAAEVLAIAQHAGITKVSLQTRP